MWHYEDTNFNEFSVKNVLSDREFSSDEVQFQIAFAAFDQSYDEQTQQYERTLIEDNQYINYNVSLWTFDGSKYTLDEIITTHRCNETDKRILSQNFD